MWKIKHQEKEFDAGLRLVGDKSDMVAKVKARIHIDS